MRRRISLRQISSDGERRTAEDVRGSRWTVRRSGIVHPGDGPVWKRGDDVADGRQFRYPVWEMERRFVKRGAVEPDDVLGIVVFDFSSVGAVRRRVVRGKVTMSDGVIAAWRRLVDVLWRQR